MTPHTYLVHWNSLESQIEFSLKKTEMQGKKKSTLDTNLSLTVMVKLFNREQFKGQWYLFPLDL